MRELKNNIKLQTFKYLRLLNEFLFFSCVFSWTVKCLLTFYFFFFDLSVVGSWCNHRIFIIFCSVRKPTWKKHFVSILSWTHRFVSNGFDTKSTYGWLNANPIFHWIIYSSKLDTFFFEHWTCEYGSNLCLSRSFSLFFLPLPPSTQLCELKGTSLLNFPSRLSLGLKVPMFHFVQKMVM